MSKDPMIDERPVRIPPTNPDDPLQPDTGAPAEPVYIPPDSDPTPDSPPYPLEPEIAPDSLPGTESPRPEEPPLF